MKHSASVIQGPGFPYQSHRLFCSTSTQNPLYVPHRLIATFKGVRSHEGVKECGFRKHCADNRKYADNNDQFSLDTKVHAWEDDDSPLKVQTLRMFPCKKLYGKTVLVRFDANLVLNSKIIHNQSTKSLLSTIKYLYNAGTKILLVGNWHQKDDSPNAKFIADHLSSILQLKVVPVDAISNTNQVEMEKLGTTDVDVFLLENLEQFKQETANCSKFAKQLSAGVDIFVNEAFSLAHKSLASTVGITRFCCMSVAGFHFEEELTKLMKIVEITGKPYIVIVGGANFSGKKAALHLLLSKCDQMVFVGELAFQIMHASGCPVPQRLVDRHSIGEVLDFVQLANDRNVPLLCPTDFLCINDCLPEDLGIFPADGIINGWTPRDIGPSSLEKIYSFILKSKKVLWIGPVKFDGSTVNTSGAYELARKLEERNRTNCDLIVVGSAACKSFRTIASSTSCYYFEKASTVWEFLKGRTLPGAAALDKAYTFDVVWETMFQDPMQHLVVDVGSGNGLFVLEMAQKWRELNFLGLEINGKLAKRCLQDASQSCLHNVYFLSTNATHSFHSIISRYHGKLALVSIQCPNPDFNKENHRWRMVQRSLVEAIIELLMVNGKVFLQSDVEEVARRMKEQFMTYGKDILVVDGEDDRWLKENPFGVRSDWEQHVVDRGAPMYRVMLTKHCTSPATIDAACLSSFSTQRDL